MDNDHSAPHSQAAEGAIPYFAWGRKGVVGRPRPPLDFEI